MSMNICPDHIFKTIRHVVCKFGDASSRARVLCKKMMTGRWMIFPTSAVCVVWVGDFPTSAIVVVGQ